MQDVLCLPPPSRDSWCISAAKFAQNCKAQSFQRCLGKHHSRAKRSLHQLRARLLWIPAPPDHSCLLIVHNVREHEPPHRERERVVSISTAPSTTGSVAFSHTSHGLVACSTLAQKASDFHEMVLAICVPAEAAHLQLSTSCSAFRLPANHVVSNPPSSPTKRGCRSTCFDATFFAKPFLPFCIQKATAVPQKKNLLTSSLALQSGVSLFGKRLVKYRGPSGKSPGPSKSHDQQHPLPHLHSLDPPPRPPPTHPPAHTHTHYTSHKMTTFEKWSCAFNTPTGPPPTPYCLYRTTSRIYRYVFASKPRRPSEQGLFCDICIAGSFSWSAILLWNNR